MDLDTKLLLASKSYSEDLAQRALITNIPFIGGVIDSMFTNKWQTYYSQRLEIFFSCVEEEFADVEANKINKDYFETEEFFDLLIQTIEKSVKTRHKQKVTLYSKLLKAKALNYNLQKYENEDILYIIDSLTPQDLIVIKSIIMLRDDLALQKQNEANPNDFDDFIKGTRLKKNLDIGENEIILSLTKLNNLGLIKEYYAGNVFGLTPGGNYKTTEIFDVFLKILINSH